DNLKEQYLKLIELKNLTLNPMHISCLALIKKNQKISTDLILCHFNDLNQFLTINNIVKLLAIDMTNESNKTFETNLFNERLLQLSADCLPLISLTSSYLLSDKHNSIGLLNEKLYQFNYLKHFLTLNFET